MTAALTPLIDDVTLDGQILLYRRVAWDQVGGRKSYSNGTVPGITGNFFADYPPERAASYGFAGAYMAISIEPILRAHGLTAAGLLDPKFLNGRNPSEFGVVSFRIVSLRSLQAADGSPRPQGIMGAETTAEPWHGVIFDLVDGERAKSTRKAIAKIASWELELRA